MKKLIRILAFSALLILMIPNPTVAASKQSKASGGTLVGTWQCTGNFGIVPLVFESQNRVVFDGDPANYCLVPGAIRVQEDEGPMDYA
jgi:hypothetical protein